jgi:hypothetical protein
VREYRQAANALPCDGLHDRDIGACLSPLEAGWTFLTVGWICDLGELRNEIVSARSTGAVKFDSARIERSLRSRYFTHLAALFDGSPGVPPGLSRYTTWQFRHDSER